MNICNIVDIVTVKIIVTVPIIVIIIVVVGIISTFIVVILTFNLFLFIGRFHKISNRNIHEDIYSLVWKILNSIVVDFHQSINNLHPNKLSECSNFICSCFSRLCTSLMSNTSTFNYISIQFILIFVTFLHFWRDLIFDRNFKYFTDVTDCSLFDFSH